MFRLVPSVHKGVVLLLLSCCSDIDSLVWRKSQVNIKGCLGLSIIGPVDDGWFEKQVYKEYDKEDSSDEQIEHEL